MVFGIINILLMAVFERTQEFGVLMAIGMEKAKIRGLIVLESLWLGLTGASVGLIIAIVATKLFSVTGIDLSLASEGLAKFGVDTLLYPRVDILDFVIVFITVVVASLVSALYPARQILKQRPVDAMKRSH